MIARALGSAVSLLVLVASGAYLIVYLYRWEWNRALVAGLFFVAAEVAIVATALLRRLRALETRLDQQEAHRAAAPLDRLRDSRPEPPDRFRWLDPTGLNVFVPVLLGAGVILSLLAHGVERLAASTAVPLRERALASRLDALALPPGGLLGPRQTGDAPALRPARARDWRPVARWAFATVAGTFLIVAALQVIAEQTQDRPDPPPPGRSADVVLRIDRRFTNRSELHTAEALFVACRHTLGPQFVADGFDVVGGGHVAFTVTPSFGRHAQRRFVGCLEDAQFDRVSGDVVSVRHNP